MSEYELAHHGKKGMHWGVMNGPPYPLNKQGLAKFRANAKKFSDKAQKGVDKVARGADAARIKINKAANGLSRAKAAVKANGARRSAKMAVKNAAKEKKMAAKREKVKAKLDKQQTKKNDLTSLSDEELRTRINRMQMERQYRQLVKERAAETAGKENYVKQLAIKTGKQMAEQAAKGLGDRAVKGMLNNLDKKNKSEWEKKYEKLKKDTKEIKALNEYIKTLHTNEDYNAGRFNNEKDNDDKDKKKNK